MNRQTRRYLYPLAAGVVIASFVASSPAWAQWPAKPFRIVVGYAPGGGSDITARLVAPKMSDIFKQSVIVDNRVGAAGMIAEGLVTKSPPEGYTLLLDPPGAAMNPSLYRSVPFDPKELQPVAQLVSLTFVIVINPQVPAKDVGELISHIKKRPKEVNVAVAGPSTQLVTELFKLIAGVDLTLIPYKGSAPSSTSVIAGETQLMFADVPSVAQHIANGRLRALAVTAGKRVNSMSNVPTARESGLPGYEASSWYAVFAPAGTPRNIVTRLNGAFNQIVMMPDIQPKLTQLGADPVNTSVEEFERFYRSEVVRWKDVVTRAKIPLND